MKKPRLDWVLAVLMSVSAAAVGACGGDDATGDDGTGDDGTGDDTPGTPDAGDPGGPDADLGDWKVLNQGEWTLNPGKEKYICIVQTLAQDTTISAFKGMSPAGTHHTVLTIYDGAKADGIYDCSATENGQSMIFGTGVGTPEMTLPDGIAVRLEAGQRLINNVHLFNASDQVITGTSGTLYKPFQGTPTHLAEIVLTGKVLFKVDPGVQTVTGGCAIDTITDEPIQVFAISPHMHMLGTHMTSTIVRGDQRIVIQDTPYDFDNQAFTMQMPFIELKPGDFLETKCTYNNTTGKTVFFGQSSKDEMCFTDIMYYPAQGAQFTCAN